MNPKIIQIATSILQVLKPVGYAFAGGLMAGGVLKCGKQEPVQLIVTNQAYEKQLSDVRAKVDTINSVIPTMSESIEYLSKRYPEK